MRSSFLRSRRWAWLLVAAQVTAYVPVASAQGKPAAPATTTQKPLAETLTGEALDKYKIGLTLYGARDFANAYERFREVHRLSGDARLLWNMAICQKSLAHYAQTQSLLNRYLTDAGAAGLLTDEDKKKADDVLGVINTLVGVLEIKLAEAGATINIDGNEVGKSPLSGPLSVDVGKRRVLVTKPDFHDFQTDIEVQNGTVATVDAKLVKISHEGKISVRTSEPGATIQIDDKTVGRGQWFGPVPVGTHLLRVSAPGFVSYQADFALTEAAVRTFDVTLKAEKKPIPLWVFIGGGVLLAGGLATASYFLFRPAAEAECTANPNTCLTGNTNLSFPLVPPGK